MVARHLRGPAIPASPALALALALAACGDEPMPPVACGNIPTQTVTVGEEATVEPCFDDPEMEPLTIAAVSLAPGIASAEVDGGNVRVTGVSPGPATIRVTATDPGMLEGELHFDVLVPNRPPVVVDTLPPVRTRTGHPPVRLVLSGHFADPDGEPLVYGATSSDTTVASVALSADTLEVTPVSESTGTTAVSVTATDPGGLSATARFEVTVLNRPPVVTGEMPPARVHPGDPEVRLALSGYFSDPDGQPLAYGATSSDTTVASVALSAGTLAVSAVTESTGTATVSVTATDPGGLGATAGFEFTVVNRPPAVAGELPRVRFEPDGPRVVRMVLSEYFSDPDGRPLAYGATSADTAVAAAALSAGTLAVSAVSDGETTVTVTATDPGGLSATARMDVRVGLNRPPVVAGELPPVRMHTGNPPVTLVLSEHFSDPDGQALAYGATPADTAVASVALSADTLAVSALWVGETTVTVTATDPGGLSATASLEVTVPNRPPVVAGELPPARIQPGGPPVRLVLSGYFSDPDGQPVSYGALSADTAVASVALSADTLAVSPGSEGETTVSVTATDPGGLGATARMHVRVGTNHPPVVVGERLRFLTPRLLWPLQSSVATNVFNKLFRDPEGDPLVYGVTSSDTEVATASVGGNSLNLRGGPKPGVATLSLTATDPGGLSATAEITVNVFSRALPFGDGFDSEESLANWALFSEATAAFADSMVRVTHPNRPGRLYAGLIRKVAALRWEVRARMGNVTDGSWAQLLLNRVPNTGHRSLALQVGADPDHHWSDRDTNWRLLGRRKDAPWEMIAGGVTGAVGDAGEPVDVVISHVEHGSALLEVWIGGERMFFSAGMGRGSRIGLTHVTLGAWPAPGTTGTKTAFFDYVRIGGVDDPNWDQASLGESANHDPPRASHRRPGTPTGPPSRGRRRRPATGR